MPNIFESMTLLKQIIWDFPTRIIHIQRTSLAAKAAKGPLRPLWLLGPLRPPGPLGPLGLLGQTLTFASKPERKINERGTCTKTFVPPPNWGGGGKFPLWACLSRLVLESLHLWLTPYLSILRLCIELLYVRTLPSHQYNLECCKNFCTKIMCNISSTCVHHRFFLSPMCTLD